MKVIYKYSLDVGTITTIGFPPGSQVLCVKVQRGKICMWVLQETNPQYPAGTCYRSFLVVGTGNPFEDNIKEYHGTVMTPNHTFVFHVFEVM